LRALREECDALRRAVQVDVPSERYHEGSVDDILTRIRSSDASRSAAVMKAASSVASSEHSSPYKAPQREPYSWKDNSAAKVADSFASTREVVREAPREKETLSVKEKIESFGSAKDRGAPVAPLSATGSSSAREYETSVSARGNKDSARDKESARQNSARDSAAVVVQSPKKTLIESSPVSSPKKLIVENSPPVSSPKREVVAPPSPLPAATAPAAKKAAKASETESESLGSDEDVDMETTSLEETVDSPLGNFLNEHELGHLTEPLEDQDVDLDGLKRMTVQQIRGLKGLSYADSSNLLTALGHKNIHF
jgi:hypothetical protein